ncbi:MAG TPA: protein kinase [Blastocatellia bacterium]|nr:protein kinase [Blastocatellia bacterium]
MSGSLPVNTSISHYRIISPLGAGGMGEVYLAEDTLLDRRVAIKFISSDSTADEQAQKRLVREARAAAKLDHPNICSIYEVGREDSRSFIVMQYIDGETLARCISRQPLELSEALEIAIQVVDALAEAHSHGIVHRDIKPQNIMLTARGQAKVMDFGLSKVVSERTLVESSVDTETQLTAPGIVMGTAPYMSPEQIRGEDLDARSDIFSFGVVFYELVSGRQPFTGETAAATLSEILTREPQPLSRYVGEAPSQFQWIASKALRKNKGERYQTAKELFIDLSTLREDMMFAARLDRSTAPEASRVTLPVGDQSSVHAQNEETLTGKVDTTTDRPDVEHRHRQTARRRLALAGLAVSVFAIAGLAYLLSQLGKQEPIGSLAVLPFVNASNDPNAEYLSDGITESIISALAQVGDLKVMSSNSVFRYKGKPLEARAIGRELGVRAVVVGRLVQRGDTLSISTELIDVHDSSQLWGEQYNRKSSDILAVQEEIARQISEKLRLRLSGEDKGRLGKRYTESAEAYELYLKGRFHQNKRTEDELKRSIDYFKQAVVKDPKYALAHSGISDSYSYLGNHGFLAPKEVSPEAKEAALRALEIDDRLAEAHTSLAYVKVNYDWDWAGAESEFKRAIELNTSYTRAHSLLAAFLTGQGRSEEALAEMKRALELDPLSIYDNTNLGWHLHMARRLDEAIEQFRKTIEMDQSFAQAHLWLGQAYETKQMYEEAISEFRKAMAAGSPAVAALAHGYAIAGRNAEARRSLRQLEELARERYVSSYDLAVILTGLGEKDQALVRLTEAYERRDGWLAFWLKVDPRLDPLRSEPRFRDFLRRVGHTP